MYDDTIRILRGKAVSEEAVNDDKSLRLHVDSSESHMYETDFKAVVDLNEQFQKERAACTKYRVIATLQPYCTNVLFNTCTEIVRNEGSDDVEVVDGVTAAELTRKDKANLFGPVVSVGPYEMVRNTEYSKDSVGYTYHPGTDIFNNHILRNRSYRIVNRPKTQNPTSEARRVFNTIEDLARYSDGNTVKRCRRREVSDTEMLDKHLYDAENVLTVYDRASVSENLREEDGWFGFVNTSVIPSKDASGADMDISRAVNDRGNCEFVDMYPDRSLFSLTPKYNRFRNRLERNWEWTLTYPFGSAVSYEETDAYGNTVTKDIKLVQDNGCNALAVLDARYEVLANTRNAVVFRCAVRHNLSVGDKVAVWFNKEDGEGGWERIGTPFIVSGLGDADGSNQAYFFQISDTSLLEYIFTPDTGDASRWDYVRTYFYSILNLNNIEQTDPSRRYYPQNLVSEGGDVWICDVEGVGFSQDRFSRFSDYAINEYDPGLEDIPSGFDAYIRVGGDIYELYNHDTGTPFHSSAYDADRFVRNIVNNAFRDEGDGSGPASGASGTLWSDYIRFRFAKTDGSSDSRYYVRKFRKFPNMKYGTDQDEPIADAPFNEERYRLAYARTVYGDEIAQTVFTDSVDIGGLTDNLGRPLSEIYLTVVKTNRGHSEWYADRDFGNANVEFSHCFGPITCGFDIFGMCSDTRFLKDWRLDLSDAHMICNAYAGDRAGVGGLSDITVSDGWWYGDVAEFCPWTCTETPLADILFRFNTAQREYDRGDADDRFPFRFDEIVSDDYDYSGFRCESYTVGGASRKNEGYIYKPHMRIALKGFGSVVQASNRALIPMSATPVQADRICISVRTSLPHGLFGGEKVLLRDKSDPTWAREWALDVVSVQNSGEFVMETVPHGSDPYVSWHDICDGLGSGLYALNVVNTGIPAYAVRIKSNTYLWRNPTDAWDTDNQTEGLDEFPFANGHLYADKVFSLFVRRQDPYGCNLLNDQSPRRAVPVSGDYLETQCTCDQVSDEPAEPDGLYRDDSFATC